MYWLQQVQSQKPTRYPRPSTSLRGKQIRMEILEYGPPTILYHTRGQVLGSMYADTISMIQTSQISTKYGLKKETEEY